MKTVTVWPLLPALCAALLSAACLSDYDFECEVDQLEVGSARFRNRDAAERTPQWTPGGDAVIVNVGEGIYKFSTTAPPQVWEISVRHDSTAQLSPRMLPDGRVSYINYDYGPTCRLFRNRQGRGPDKFHVEIINQDGTGLQRWPDELLTRYLPPSPIWSPDGRHAVLESNGPLITDPQGNAVTADGERLLILDPQGNIVSHESRPAAFISQWSPDGLHLAYRQRIEINDGGSRIYSPTLGRLSADLSRVTGVVSYGSTRKGFSSGGWNKAGDRYYFAATDWDMSAPNSETRILALNLHQPEPEIITVLRPARRVERVIPSPDGDRLLISDGNTVSVMDIDGSSEAQSCCPQFWGSVNDKLFVSWSPDGEWIAVYNASLIPNPKIRLWLVRPDGSEVRDIWVTPPGTEAPDGSNQAN